MTDLLDSQFNRAVAAPINLPKPLFEIGQLLKDSDGDIVQIIGLEWSLTDINREPYWKYAIWDISLGCVLDAAQSLLATYTVVKS